ncbi:MAG: SelB C-terminal domain-containing protein, partial [Nitrospirae bacterium]|nr:SelB C-terminal domain-containing protein [Nitrospirota bacterium]
EDLNILRCGTLEEKLLSKILQSGINGIAPVSLHGWIKAEIPGIKTALNSLVQKGEAVNSGGRLYHKSACEGFTKKVISAVSDFHRKNPLKAGMPKENLKMLFKGLEQKTIDELLTLSKDLAVEKEILRLKTFSVSLSDDKKFLKDKILRALESAAFQPPMKDELARAVAAGEKEVNELLKIMAAEKSLVRINDSLYIPLSSYEKMLRSLGDFFKKKQEMTVAEFRDVLGTTRKYALPFLEFLDSSRVTLRVGDVRKFILKS